MPPSATQLPLVLIAGDDDFAVKQKARKLYDAWCAESGGFDHEIISASASNSSEALKIIAKLRAAMQTLPFFGSSKVIWLQNCNFLGEERAASSSAVVETLNELTDEFKKFDFSAARLLISAGKVDKRRAFYKTIDKLGTVENFDGWSADDRDWADQAELEASKRLQTLGKTISPDALGQLVANVGPNRRALHNEIEKLGLFVGDRTQIAPKDVQAIVTKTKSARAFALADAVGERDLKAVLRALDEEVWEMKTDSSRSEIGVLYGLISKVRAMILVKEMVREGWVNKRSEYNRFKTDLTRIPSDKLPQDKRFNPVSINAYVLYRAMQQSGNYTEIELVRAMELLLVCNQKLISSALDEVLVLQQTLVDIVGQNLGAARPQRVELVS